MARSIPPAAPPPCLKPCTASARCFARAGVPSAPSSSAVGTPKRKASSAQPNGSSSRATPSTTPSPISMSMSPSPGPDFSASAVPSLKEFVRDVTRSVPSPVAGTVYRQWRSKPRRQRRAQRLECAAHRGRRSARRRSRLRIGFHALPATRRRALHRHRLRRSLRRLSLHLRRLCLVHAERRSRTFSICRRWRASSALKPCAWPMPTCCPSTTSPTRARSPPISKPPSARPPTAGLGSLDFAPAQAAAARFAAAAQRVYAIESAPSGDLAQLNLALRQTETALLSDAGLPNRPWYRHTIYAPGEYTGYAAVVIPGVNEAIDARNATLAAQQLTVLAHALDRAAKALSAAH